MTDPERRSTATQELIYAALETLQIGFRVDLCAFLSRAEGQGPQLFLGVPDLSSIDANKAFALFTALREALENAEGPFEEQVAGYNTWLVPAGSELNRGLLAVGRRRETLGRPEQASVERFARAMTGLIATEPPVAAAPAIVRLAIDSSGGRCTAHVSVDVGDQIAHGTAEDAVATRAVATAVLDALEKTAHDETVQGFKVVEAADGEIGSTRAIMVLIQDDMGRMRLGSALQDDAGDLLHATAWATLRACL